MRKKSFVTKIKALMIVVSILMTSLICACDFWDKISVSEESISSQELIRHISLAIDDEDYLTTAYESIPDHQLPEVSYSSFVQYIHCLARMSNSNGKIVSFRLLDKDTSDNIMQSMLYVEDELSIDVSSSYGDVRVAELLYEEANEESINAELCDASEGVFVYYQIVDGHAVITNEWIADTLMIFSYAEHYISMLDSHNVEGVVALLEQTFVGDEYTEEVLIAKAQRIAEFYWLRVHSPSTSYEFKVMSPLTILVSIPEVLDADGESIVSHFFSLNRTYDNRIVFDEVLEQPLSINSLYLYQDDVRTLRLGSEYLSTEVIRQLGEPSMITYGTEIFSSHIDANTGETVVSRLVVVSYDYVLLTFEAVIGEDNTWEGTLRSIRLLEGDENYSCGDLYVGMPLSELLTNYPMLDVNDFDLRYVSSNTYVVDMELTEDNQISNIRVHIE